MNRRAFLISLAVGIGALTLAMRPQGITLPRFKGFKWECRGRNGVDFMVMESPHNPPNMPELLDAERHGWRSVTMTTVWN